MKESLERLTTQLNGYRVEVTSLKIELESLISSTARAVNQKQASVAAQMESFRSGSESECEETVVMVPVTEKSIEEQCVMTITGPQPMEDRFTDLFENSSVVDSNGFRTPDEGDENGHSTDFLEHLNNHAGLQEFQNEHTSVSAYLSLALVRTLSGYYVEGILIFSELCVWQELGTVHILADALPKIAPFVLINHREVPFLPYL